MALSSGQLAAARSRPPQPVQGEMDKRGVGQLNSYLNSYNTFWTTPNKLFGGVSPKEAKQLFQQWTGIELASNSLYLIEIKDLKPDPIFQIGNTEAFQLFTTAINYTPVTIPADKQNVGSAVIDGVKTTEHIDLTLETYDDTKGTLKRWCDYKAGKTANSDGTVGLPIDYLVKVRILHSFFSDKTNKGGYEASYLMRIQSAEYPLSREDGGKQKLNIALTQFDTFMVA